MLKKISSKDEFRELPIQRTILRRLVKYRHQ